jgi:hypothetical protein
MLEGILDEEDVAMSAPVLTGRPPRSAGHRAPTAPLWTSWLLGAVLVAATSYGLIVEGAYRSTPTRPELHAILRGQDALTLLAVPLLLWAAHRARAGSLRAHVVWLGVLLYVPYTYLMYVVVPHNDAFLLYVAAIGLGFYLLLDGLLRVDAPGLRTAFAATPTRAVGWFLVLTGGLFVAMWLAMIVPTIPGGIPDGLFVYDVPSTVHVMDLAFVLPLLIGTGVGLLRGHVAAPLIAGMLLVKTVTLGLALLAMNLVLAVGGSGFNPGETALWSVVIAGAAALLLWSSRRLGPLPSRWMHPSLWER